MSILKNFKLKEQVSYVKKLLFYSLISKLTLSTPQDGIHVDLKNDKNKDKEKMLFKDNKYVYRKNSHGADSDDSIVKLKSNAFRYEDTKKFVSVFQNNPKSIDTVDENKKMNVKKKKIFTFLNNNPADEKLSEIVADDVIHESQKSPLFKNKYENEEEEEHEEEDDDEYYEKTYNSKKLLNNLENKLFAIAAGTLPLDSNEELYSTIKKQQKKDRNQGLNKDTSFNTISTNLHSDSSTSNSIKHKMITFTSLNSVENNEPDGRINTQPKQSSPRQSPENVYSTIKRVKMPTPFVATTNKIEKNENSKDICESKFLSNLCEEIELTLNGDILHDESSSSANVDSNVNSELSTTSSLSGKQNKNVEKHKVYNNHISKKIINRRDENNNSNMIVDTSRLPNERNIDYNYNHRSTKSPHEEFTIRKTTITKNIGVLV